MSMQQTTPTPDRPVPLRDRFPAGAQFRVTAEGARLRGFTPAGRGAFHSWSHDLHVGDVIECTRDVRGFGADPGYGVHWTSPDVDSAGAVKVTFSPSQGSIFDYHPADGYLEQIHPA